MNVPIELTPICFEQYNTSPILTIHPDGRVTVTDQLKPDEAAAKVVEAFKTQWMADTQATKIRELEAELQACKILIEELERSLSGWIKRYAELNSSRFQDKPDMRLPWEKTPEAKA